MKPRIIEVKRCSADDCPYNVPSTTTVSLCTANELDVIEMRREALTFPRFCPLNEITEEK